MIVFNENWFFDTPSRQFTKNGRMVLCGYFREIENGTPIYYRYHPREHELYVGSTEGLWWVYHRFRVERLSKTRFRLTPIRQSFTVEAFRAIF